MGRRRVELKRIENKINRQVTFAKRRNGVFKKAYELSILCDVEVSLIIFSNRGKLFQYSSISNMDETLDRYRTYTYGSLEVSQPAKETLSGYNEYIKLKEKVEDLQRTQRNLLGEDVGNMSTMELDQLEHQLDFSLKQIRSIKTQSMLDKISDLQRKDQMLQETNKAMMRKLGESSADDSLPTSLEGTVAQRIPCSFQPARSDDFFVPLECNSTLHNGYSSTLHNGYNHSVLPDQDQMSSVNSEQNVNHFIPGWML